METAMLTRTVLILCATAILAGCVDIPDPPILSRAVDPTSPVSQRVRQVDVASRDLPYPDLNATPSVPGDARSQAAWNEAAATVVVERERLEQWRAANPPYLTDTEAFAAETRASVGLDLATLPAAPTPEESADYARRQRERAAPRD
jgi:hypothetical protein